MGNKKQEILSYIDKEMPDSHNKNAVKEYINNITLELSKRRIQDTKRRESKEKRIIATYSSRKERKKIRTTGVSVSKNTKIGGKI